MTNSLDRTWAMWAAAAAMGMGLGCNSGRDGAPLVAHERITHAPQVPRMAVLPLVAARGAHVAPPTHAAPIASASLDARGTGGEGQGGSTEGQTGAGGETASTGGMPGTGGVGPIVTGGGGSPSDAGVTSPQPPAGCSCDLGADAPGPGAFLFSLLGGGLAIRSRRGRKGASAQASRAAPRSC